MLSLRKAKNLARCVVAQVRRGSVFPDLDQLGPRHIGIVPHEEQSMLREVNAEDMPQFLKSVVPQSILEKRDLPADGVVPGEHKWLAEFAEMMGKNKIMKQCIGMGYHETKVPNVVLRNVIESPGWYTPYTPYQAEISQGRLESLMNFQQMVIDLTGLPLSNASLLDEATAVGEAVAFSQHKSKRTKCFLDFRLHPASIAVAQTRACGLGIEIEVGDVTKTNLADPNLAMIIVQYPDTYGEVHSYQTLFGDAKSNGVMSCCVADLMSLALLTPPGELGADCACGTTQRFGVPLGYGGPHAAYFATTVDRARAVPGRIIGLSQDKEGKTVYRMALQTREQHIKRDKATSNICTAQALLANVAAMYGVYHGPTGIRKIAEAIHLKTKVLALGLKAAGAELQTKRFFDTIRVKPPASMDGPAYFTACQERGVNVRLIDDATVGIALDECTEETHLAAMIEAAGGVADLAALKAEAETWEVISQDVRRTSAYMEHPVFNIHHSETAMMRYIYRLEKKDLGLNTAMIPLGSCTMKLNAAVEMLPITWASINSLHPFAPVEQCTGYVEMLRDLEEMLNVITGMDATSLQPNAGAQGEYTGLRTIAAYHASRGESHRDVCIIPSSAHGTNPASAAMCGMRIAVVKCLPSGAVDVDDLHRILAKHEGRVAASMITYPSTFGVFDENIKEITSAIHDAGGQCYIDGANMNAQMGLSFPGEYGGDVLHLNLHKTFSIPHGGGGPGMGPICMRAHLAPFMPSTASPGITCGGEQPMGQIAQAPYGSASVLPISYTYMKLMGWHGLKRSAEVALLSANYLKEKLKHAYPVLYENENGRCAHEFIIDLRPFKKTAAVEVEDVAKRLMDYNFHAPTMSFPVAGTLMIEPTESETKWELDRFVEAMLAIRQEIRDIEEGVMPQTNNPLKNAPHTQSVLLAEEWNRPYSREQAAFPLPSVRMYKQWPTCSRIDSAFGDRNFVCSCPPMESYEHV